MKFFEKCCWSWVVNESALEPEELIVEFDISSEQPESDEAASEPNSSTSTSNIPEHETGPQSQPEHVLQTQIETGQPSPSHNIAAQAVPIRRSARSHSVQTRVRDIIIEYRVYQGAYYELLLDDDDEPETFADTKGDLNWVNTMKSQLCSIEKNGTWKLTDLP